MNGDHVAKSANIPIKKRFGQHFLRDSSVTDHMIEQVVLTPQSSVFEIGCGDGFLTRTILTTPIERLWIFEIDQDWVNYVRSHIKDARMTVFHENVLDLDFKRLEPYAPWTLLANLPYQVTFPILHMLQRNIALLKEGVIMVQEEVAQKIVKTHGRGYGHASLFFQHHFEWRLLKQVPPGAFLPPPKVFSRLLYFKPRVNKPEIPQEEQFWKFIKLCFHQPRRTLHNNLSQSHYDLNKLDPETLKLRAQQMNMADFLRVWDLLR
jgi:16S rRNA (adenine1518-N6/adenine1519-N6)-dimethyltransferase